MGDYIEPDCKCGEMMVYIISAPSVHTWNQWREFPNVTKHGDGSKKFETKSDYNVHLKENHIAESSTDAPVKTPHGNKLVSKVRL